jgi:non-ribosomal peptide synthetase-like protein
VTIGDDVSVGASASLQTHLFEDRVMNMDHVTLRDRATIGDKAVVLSGSVVEEDATLSAMSLAMKGEVLPAGTTWCGIPAQKVNRAPAPPPGRNGRRGQTGHAMTGAQR